MAYFTLVFREPHIGCKSQKVGIVYNKVLYLVEFEGWLVRDLAETAATYLQRDGVRNGAISIGKWGGSIMKNAPSDIVL